MSLKFRSIPTKTLAQNLASSGTTLYLNNSLDWDGGQLSSADFGTQAFAVLRNAANTQIELIEIDPTTVTSASAITIIKRGLGYDGTQVANTETKYNWNAFDTYVELGADTPQIFEYLVGVVNAAVIAGAPNATTILQGLVEEASTAEIDAGTATGGTGAKLFAPLDKLALSIYGTRLPSAAQKLALVGSGGTVGAANRYVTEEGGVNKMITSLTEETSSGITAGVPVFMQSDAEASKTGTVKTFLSAARYYMGDRASATVGESVFDMNVVWLTQNRFAATWTTKSSTTYYMMAGVGVVSDTGAISLFDSTLITTSATASCLFDMIRLSDTSFVVQTYNSANQNSTWVVSMDDSFVLTVGSAVTTNVSQASLANMDRLSDTSFIMVYVTPSAAFDMTVVVASVSGTTITFGSPVTVDVTSSNFPKVAALSSTVAVISWGVTGSTKAQVVTISGTTPTLGASSYNVNTSGDRCDIVALSATKFAIAYNDATGSGNVKTRVGTVAGDVITLGTAITVSTYNNGYGTVAVCAFGQDFIVLVQQGSSTAQNFVQFGHIKVSGSTVTLGNVITVSGMALNYNGISYKPVIATVNGHVIIAGKGGEDAPGVWSFKPVYNEVLMGVASSAPVSTVVPIIIKGRTGALYSGLTFNKKYLFNQDGTISETGVVPGGTAISTTELLIN